MMLSEERYTPFDMLLKKRSVTEVRLPPPSQFIAHTIAENRSECSRENEIPEVVDPVGSKSSCEDHDDRSRYDPSGKYQGFGTGDGENKPIPSHPKLLEVREER